MKASKNAHDWHCEAHDTYGWVGEECRKCPVAPSETTAIREQVEKLTKERDEYKTNFFELSRAFNNQELQLAALAEQNEKMREALRLARFDSLNMTLAGWEKLKEAAVLPDLATPVLNRIRAEGMRMAADICSEKHSLSGAEEAIRARADELEKSNG